MSMRWREVRCYRCGQRVGEVRAEVSPESGPIARFRCLRKAGGCGALVAAPWPPADAQEARRVARELATEPPSPPQRG